MASGRFIVQTLRSAKEVGAVFIPRSAKLGWKPGALDHLSFFAADQSGFFAGKLDDKTISCLSIVKYSQEYAYAGHYIVDELYRGQGYGLATCKYVLSGIPDSCNCALDAVYEMSSRYGSFGYKSEWENQRMVIKFSAGLELKLHCNLEGISVVPATEVVFNELLSYDTSVYVYARPSFLEKWISAPNCLSYAALDEQGHVVGYAVVRTAYRKEDGWKVGPLFADTSQIARNLLHTMVREVLKRDSNTYLSIDVPRGDGCNAEGLTICTELQGEPSMTTVRMYTKGPPANLPLAKIFGVTTLEIG